MESLFRLSFRSLGKRKLRTALTLLGIIIGIATIVALISLGDSMKNSITEQLNQLGPNRIIVMPQSSGSGFGAPSGGAARVLTQSDLDKIRNLKGVESAIPIVTKSFPVTYKKTTKLVTIMGVAAKDSEDFFSDVQTFDLKGGRFFKDGEINTIVLGSMVADGYFDTDPQLKSKININGIDVRVVGILQPVGSQSEDLAIMTSIETIKGLLDNPNEITMIMVKANGDPQTVADEIEKLLDKRHGKGLFSAMTTDQILKRIESVLSIMTFILVGIAAISLLVAAFGIMNTMLMSVLERTREIGVMKAIGATNRQVLLIFLYESIAIGIIGGVIGVLLGAGFTNILIAVFRGFTGMSMTAFINPLLLVFGVIFAVIVSVASGIYPARRAAKLDPIEALRYE